MNKLYKCVRVVYLPHVTKFLVEATTESSEIVHTEQFKYLPPSEIDNRYFVSKADAKERAITYAENLRDAGIIWSHEN